MIKLLDCTLRDGGYINNWEFNQKMQQTFAQKLSDANIDLIEVGFLDQRVEENSDRTIMPDMLQINKAYENIDLKNTELVAMIDYGTFDIDRIVPKSESLLSGIRVIFTQDKIKEALEFCNQIKQKGYKVYANAVNITNYKPQDYVDLFNAVNKVNVDGVTMVDTYGVLMPDELNKIYDLFDANVNSDIALCFHAHNTLQMAAANAITFINHVNPNRINIIDGTLSGMGKGSGNAYTELIIKYINSKDKNSKYKLSGIISMLEKEMEDIKKNYSWDFSLCRFVSAIHDVYYKYTDYYSKVKGISYAEIEAIESLIKEEDKFVFSQEKAETYYEEYRKSNKYKYKYVIFDVDGTLLDTTEGILSAIDYTINQYKLNDLDYDNKLYFIGPPIQDSFKKAYGLNDEEATAVANIFRDRYKNYELLKAKVYDGIIELLASLKESGVKVGVATYKREDYAIEILKHFGIDKYCDVIKGSDYEGKLSKYDIIAKVIEELGVQNLNEVVMIGDSENDLIGARENNLPFIGVTYGFGFTQADDEKDFPSANNVKKLSKFIM